MKKTELINYLDSFSARDLLTKSKVELSVMFGNDFSNMLGYCQNNPHHCYDLLEHTIKTVEALNLEGLSPSEVSNLKIAALYHDVGKPIVSFEKEGRKVFYNHAKESKNIAEKQLTEFGFAKREIDKICFYIEHHDDFISFRFNSELKGNDNPHIKEITRGNVCQKIHIVQEEAKNHNRYVPTYCDYGVLMRLCTADVNAQAEEVFIGENLVDSKCMKLSRINAIENIVFKYLL